MISSAGVRARFTRRVRRNRDVEGRNEPNGAQVVGLHSGVDIHYAVNIAFNGNISYS